MGLTVYNWSKSEGSMMYDDAYFQCIFLHLLANITRMTTSRRLVGALPQGGHAFSKFGGVEPGWRRRLQKNIGVSTLGKLPFDHSTRFHKLLLT
jgi:hypothetical protein